MIKYFVLFVTTISYCQQPAFNRDQDFEFENDIPILSIIEDDEYIYSLDENYGLLKLSKNGQILNTYPGLELSGKMRPYPIGFCLFNNKLCVFDGVLKGKVYRFSKNLIPIDTLNLNNPVDHFLVRNNKLYIHSKDIKTDNLIEVYDVDFNVEKVFKVTVDSLFPHRNLFSMLDHNDEILFYNRIINKVSFYDYNFNKIDEESIPVLPDSAKCLNFGAPPHIKDKKIANNLAILPQEILIDNLFSYEDKYFFLVSKSIFNKQILFLDDSFNLLERLNFEYENLITINNESLYAQTENKVHRFDIK